MIYRQIGRWNLSGCLLLDTRKRHNETATQQDRAPCGVCGDQQQETDFKKTTYREAGRVSEACATLTAQVHAVGISYSSDLQQSEQDNVNQINQRLRHIFASRYIKPLKPEDTITPEDDIHYNPETTKTIWKNIIEHVSERTKNQ